MPGLKLCVALLTAWAPSGSPQMLAVCVSVALAEVLKTLGFLEP